MWILILTLLSYHGKAVSSAGEFKSYEACNAAATEWIKQVNIDSWNSRPIAICARKD